MLHYQPELPHIIFLFSDTGGGHRSATEAIIEAINLEFPNQITSEMVDIFREYMPPPLDLAPEIYPPLSRMPDLWKLGYRASDNLRRKRLINNALYPFVARSVQKLVKQNPADLYVSVHPLSNTPVLQALDQTGIKVPFVTVITDMVSVHAFWYDPRADLVVVATEEALKRGMAAGVPEEKMRVVGLPVADRFCHPAEDRDLLREKLGWPKECPMIVLVGGGEGMGPLEQTARAINHAHLPAALAIVTGRNRVLKNTLEKQSWEMPTYIYGFVREMPDFMRAADVLVTKAGPGTISEAFIAGLPLILYSRMPGQEDGNVDFVVSEDAGAWASEPETVISILKNWLTYPERRQQVAANCRRLARPQASRQIAQLLAAQVGVGSPNVKVFR